MEPLQQLLKKHNLPLLLPELLPPLVIPHLLLPPPHLHHTLLHLHLLLLHPIQLHLFHWQAMELNPHFLFHNQMLSLLLEEDVLQLKSNESLHPTNMLLLTLLVELP